MSKTAGAQHCIYHPRFYTLSHRHKGLRFGARRNTRSQFPSWPNNLSLYRQLIIIAIYVHLCPALLKCLKVLYVLSHLTLTRTLCNGHLFLKKKQKHKDKTTLPTVTKDSTRNHYSRAQKVGPLNMLQMQFSSGTQKSDLRKQKQLL